MSCESARGFGFIIFRTCRNFSCSLPFWFFYLRRFRKLLKTSYPSGFYHKIFELDNFKHSGGLFSSTVSFVRGLKALFGKHDEDLEEDGDEGGEAFAGVVDEEEK